MINTEILEPGRLKAGSDEAGIHLAMGLPNNTTAIASMTDDEALTLIDDLLVLVAARDLGTGAGRPAG